MIGMALELKFLLMLASLLFKVVKKKSLQVSENGLLPS
jgi:hypothetical protein